MAETGKNTVLLTLEHLGEGTALAQQIFDMIGHSKFFADFSRDDVQMLAAFMQVYRAEPGNMIIREGDVDDYMLLIIQGKVDIVKTDKRGVIQAIDRKSTRLNSSHVEISYAVFCLKKKTILHHLKQIVQHHQHHFLVQH